MRSDLCPNGFTVAAGGRGAGGNSRFTGFGSVACVFDSNSRRWLLALQPWKASSSSRLFHGPPHFFLLSQVLLLLQLFKVAQPLRSNVVLRLAPSALPSAVEGCSHKQARSTEGAKDQECHHLTHHLTCTTCSSEHMNTLHSLQTHHSTMQQLVWSGMTAYVECRCLTAS